MNNPLERLKPRARWPRQQAEVSLADARVALDAVAARLSALVAPFASVDIGDRWMPGCDDLYGHSCTRRRGF